MELPPDLTNEWKKIGSRRTKFEDLGLPVQPAVKMFPRHTTAIFVKEAATNDSIYNQPEQRRAPGHQGREPPCQPQHAQAHEPHRLRVW